MRLQKPDTPAKDGAEGYNLREITEAMQVHKSVIEKRAAREKWPYIEEAIRGGKRRLYHLSDLPDDVALSLRLKYSPVAPTH